MSKVSDACAYILAFGIVASVGILLWLFAITLSSYAMVLLGYPPVDYYFLVITASFFALTLMISEIIS